MTLTVTFRETTQAQAVANIYRMWPSASIVSATVGTDSLLRQYVCPCRKCQTHDDHTGTYRYARVTFTI